MQMNQQHFRDLSKKLQYHSNKKSLKEKSIKKRINSQEIQKNSNYFIVQSNKINNLTQSNQTSSVYDLTLRKKYKVNLQERNQASQSQLQNLNSHQNHLIDDDQMKTEISNDNQSIAQYFETDQDQLPITILEIRPLTETKIKEKTKSLKQTFKSLLLLIQIFLKLFLLIFNKLKNITQMVFVYFKKKNKINTIKKDELFNELQYYKLPEEGIILENTEQIQSIQNKDPLICQKLKGDLKEIEQFQFENNWWDKSFFFEINQNIPKEPFELNEREFNSIFDKLKEKNYYLLKYLAKGGEGLVFNGYKLTEGKYVSLAFKIYQSKDGISYQSEVDMMKLFEKTINVVQIFDFINISENISIFVLELCHKSLHDELKKNKKDFTLMKLFKIIFDLIDGLIELQIYNILHLDIKPSNILINNQGNYVYADFGLSVLKKKDEKIKCKGYTKDFSPKELINTSENSLVGYKTDVFSCGETIKCIIKVFNEYSDSTFCKEISDEIFKIANENMINVEIEKRLNCFDLHKKFIDLLIDADLISFMHLYLEKIPKILKLSPYDKNKNSNFFLGTELYFHQVILKIKKHLYEGNNPEIAMAMNNVGLCYKNLGENKKSMLYLQESLEMRRQLYQSSYPKHPELARSYNNVGICYQNLQNNNRALIYLNKSLTIRKQIANGGHADIAKSLNNLALCHLSMNQNEEAQNFLKQSLEIKRKEHIEEHPCVATTQNNIGSCLFKMNKFEEALEYQLKTLKTYQNSYIKNPNHIDIGTTQNNIGLCYLNINQIENALLHFQDSLKIYESIYQKNHIQIANILYNISLCYQTKGEDQQAIQYLEKSFEIIVQNKFLNKQSAILLNEFGLYNFHLAQKHKSLEYFQKSFKFLLNSLEQIKKLKNLETNIITTSQSNILFVYETLQDYQIALQYDQENQVIRKSNYEKTTLKSVRQQLKQLTSVKRILQNMQKHIKEQFQI